MLSSCSNGGLKLAQVLRQGEDGLATYDSVGKS